MTPRSDEMRPNLLAVIRRSPRLYRVMRALVSPLLPGRGAARLLRRLPPGRRILNVGSGPLIYRPDIINVDARPHPGVRCLASAAALPFADGSIDGAICEVTLEHVPDPSGAVAEMVRCLKPGGLIYLSVPFLQPLHLAPEDFTRWTIHGLRGLVGELRVLDSGAAGGPTSAVTWLLAEYAGILLSFGSSRLQAAVALLFRCLLAPFKVIDLLLVHLPSAPILASLLYVLAEKPGPSLARKPDDA